MKPEILEQFTWRDIEEIVDVSDRIMNEGNAYERFPTRESYYCEVLNRLKEKAK